MGGLDVDPPRLAGDGRNLGAKADALAAAVQALESALSSSGQMCGDDNAGKAFALNYRQSGQALFSAAEAAVNACRKVGYGIEVTASNYAHSEAASTIGGGEPSVPKPAEPPQFSGPTMPNPFGPAVGEPMLWAVVRQFVGSPWPDGNPATLRAAASAWRTFGSAVTGVTESISAGAADLTGHEIPELAKITGAVAELSSGVQGLGSQCESIAASLDSFAGEVEASQEAIRDLLHRLSASGILKEVGSILTGHNPMDDIKQVANDIKEILHTLHGEASAGVSLFQTATNELDTLTNKLEDWTRKEFTHFLGNRVGNAAATIVNGQLDFSEGALKSVLEGVGGLGQLATHPEELGKLVAEGNPVTQGAMFGHDPKGFIDQKIDMAKGLVDAKDWGGDHPLRGPGYVAGTIAQFLIPGAGEVKAGAEAGRFADEAAQAARAESNMARAGEGILGAGTESGIAAKGSSIARDLNSIDVTPREAAAPAPPVRPPEPGPSVRPAEPTPAQTPGAGAGPGASAGRPPVDAPSVPHTGGGEPGGFHEPAPTPAAEHPAPASAVPGEGVHEPAPVGSAAATGEHAPSAGIQTPSMPMTADASGGQPTLASAHAPESAPMAPAHEPIPDSYPGGAHPPEPPPPHDPGGPGGGGSGHGGGDGSSHGGTGGDQHTPVDRPGHDGSHASEDGSPIDHDGPHADEPSWNGLTDEKRDEILAMEKGERPDPSEYLSPEYIQNHLEKFHDGATRFMPESNIDKWGIAQRDGTSFVMPKSEADALMDATRGDPRGLERALGLPDGFLESKKLVRIDIPRPEEFNLRIPSGNEAGANEQWIPGGLLPDGASEAVIDGGRIPEGGYDRRDIN